MPLRYKIDILAALKAGGYSTFRIRQEKIIGESQLQQIRTGQVGSPALISKLCALLNCQPGDILEYAEGTDEEV